MPSNAKRFTRRFVFINDKEEYDDVFYRKDVTQISQYSTPNMTRITAAQRRNITEVSHVWKTGDRYYKLAYKHYGQSQYWWVIAWFNKKPTEQHVKLGDTIKVPLPLQSVLTSYGL